MTSVVSRSNCYCFSLHLLLRGISRKQRIVRKRGSDFYYHHNERISQINYSTDGKSASSTIPTTPVTTPPYKSNDANDKNESTTRSSQQPSPPPPSQLQQNRDTTTITPFQKINVAEQKMKVKTRAKIAPVPASLIAPPIRRDGQQSTSTADASHPAHHYISGGLPCDPRPAPFRLEAYGEQSLYTLVLLRHGESEWNLQNKYTGWCDVNLTSAGIEEAKTAGRLLYNNDIQIDQAFTSVLKRACTSCNLVLDNSDQHWVPITKTWRLNERHYGSLQGYNKDSAYKELHLDQELVMQMRRAYDVRPPRMDNNHTYWHGKDRRYAKLTAEQLEKSRAESLRDVADRIMPFYNKVIVPSMQAGKRCLIVAHANTIRTLIKHIDQISDEDIKSMTIPTGIPLLYRLDENMKPVDPHIELEFRYMVEPKGYTWGTSHFLGFHGIYLGDLERLQEIQRKRDVTNRDWQRIILRNIGKSLGWDMESEPDGNLGSCKTRPAPTTVVPTAPSDTSNVVETRHLWWQVHNKLTLPDYKNMLLLLRMEEALETMLHERHRKYITKLTYESLISKIHLDTEGIVVEPFVALTDRHAREERHTMWSEIMTNDLEEECLIR